MALRAKSYDRDAIGDAIGRAVSHAITLAHLDAATDALPEPCPVCHGLPCAAAYFHADVFPYASAFAFANGDTDY